MSSIGNTSLKKDNFPFSPAAELLDRVLPFSSCPFIPCPHEGFLLFLWQRKGADKPDFGVFLLGGMIEMVSTKSPPVGSVWGENCLFYLDLCIFLSSHIVHFQSPAYPKEPLGTKRSFKNTKNFKFQSQFYLWGSNSSLLSRELL